MSFTNRQLELGDLPDADRLQFEPMDKTYEREVRAQLLIVFAPLLLASLVPFLIVQKPALLLITALLLLLAVLISVLALAKARVKGIALRDHDVAYRHGLFWRKTVLLPFSRIQHVEVASGPLQRKFGLATLKFFTAGGSNVDLKVDGLAAHRAEQIRSFVTSRSVNPSDE